MGIKHFFTWFKNRFNNCIYNLEKTKTISETVGNDIKIDNLMIDMNGIFHDSAQKIYKYGNHKVNERLLGIRKQEYINFKEKDLDIYKDICNTIDSLFKTVKPQKRLILCVDGPAPLSKQNQQRKRRFLSSKEKSSIFDSNCITPGTKFMDNLTRYIDWFIRNEMSNENSLWNSIEVIFSNEKAPGEGEHKLINYIRKYGKKNESYCIHGMDADLIMLCLGTHIKNFWLLRDDMMSSAFDYYLINIGEVYKELSFIMKWDDLKSENKFNSEYAINDFIFMCFTVGNDFLPHIPGIEIIEGAIDFMLDIYKNTCIDYGHLISKTSKGLRFRKNSLSCFMGTISQYERGVFEDKLYHKDLFFTDNILENNSKIVSEKYTVDIKGYRKQYYETYFKDINIETVCHNYLDGMQWVLDYYTRGVPDWNWRYEYHYAPFSYHIAKYIKTFNFKNYIETVPTTPFIQLLSVLPPKSCKLLPKPLISILENDMKEFCPDNFEIDISGKRQSWEGTVILPIVNYQNIEKFFSEKEKDLDERDKKRNILGKSFVYLKSEKKQPFFSYYGNIESYVFCKPIEL